MTAFPKYPAYKDSGVAWLGEVPEHWGIYPNRRLFEERKVPVGKRAHEYKLLSLTLNGVIPRDMENPKGKFPAEFNTYSEVEPNDLVFCLFDLDETPRTVGISPCPGMITGAYTIFKPKLEVNPKYQFYYYLSLDEQKALKPLYTGLRKTISRSTFASAKSPCPPRAEQDRIVAFLDEKTAQIDALIAKKQRQIELLDEQKAILINRAVTRGVPSEASAKAGLHPNPDLKDSGIPWIGPIPKHWKVTRFKFCAGPLEQGWSPQCDNRLAEPEGWGVVKVGCVNGGVFKPEEHKAIPRNIKPDESLRIKPRDFLVSRANSRELVGSAALATESVWSLMLCDKVYRCRIDQQKLLPDLAVSLFATKPSRIQLEIGANGASDSMQNISQDVVKNLWVPLPPLTEQEEIVGFLREASRAIAEVVAKTESQIQTLQTLRSTLIAHAVTGKIKV